MNKILLFACFLFKFGCKIRQNHNEIRGAHTQEITNMASTRTRGASGRRGRLSLADAIDSILKDEDSEVDVSGMLLCDYF